LLKPRVLKLSKKGRRAKRDALPKEGWLNRKGKLTGCEEDEVILDVSGAESQGFRC
jgi:hypothetical protein